MFEFELRRAYIDMPLILVHSVLFRKKRIHMHELHAIIKISTCILYAEIEKICIAKSLHLKFRNSNHYDLIRYIFY